MRDCCRIKVQETGLHTAASRIGNSMFEAPRVVVMHGAALLWSETFACSSSELAHCRCNNMNPGLVMRACSP